MKQKQFSMNKNSCQPRNLYGKQGLLTTTTLLRFIIERQCIEVMLSLHSHLPTLQL